MPHAFKPKPESHFRHATLEPCSALPVDRPPDRTAARRTPVLPETIDAAYPGTTSASACRTNARDLAETIRAGGTEIERVSIAEYDDGALARLDAGPPRALDA